MIFAREAEREKREIGSSGFRGVRATLVVAPHGAGTRPARTSGVNPLNSQRAEKSLPFIDRGTIFHKRLHTFAHILTGETFKSGFSFEHHDRFQVKVIRFMQ